MGRFDASSRASKPPFMASLRVVFGQFLGRPWGSNFRVFDVSGRPHVNRANQDRPLPFRGGADPIADP